MLTTRQEIFDVVAPHLIRQGYQSTLNGICAYRGKNGLMCAVGVLIPESKYTPALEGKSATRPAIKNALEGKVGITLDLMAFIHDLQSIHDGTGIFFEEDSPINEFTPAANRWRTQLLRLAEENSLSTKCLDNVVTLFKGPIRAYDEAW